MHFRQRDQVRFVIFVQMKRAVKISSLPIVSLQTNTLLIVPDAKCCRWRMVADLLGDQLGSTFLCVPAANEKLVEERIQRLPSPPVGPVCMLLLQGAEKPFKTDKAWNAGSGFLLEVMSRAGRSAKYMGNSTKDVVLRRNGGAVILDRSPLKAATN